MTKGSFFQPFISTNFLLANEIVIIGIRKILRIKKLSKASKGERDILLQKDETILDAFLCHRFDEIEPAIENTDFTFSTFLTRKQKSIARKGKSNCFRSPLSLPAIQQLGRRQEN